MKVDDRVLHFENVRTNTYYPSYTYQSKDLSRLEFNTHPLKLLTVSTTNKHCYMEVEDMLDFLAC